MPDLLVPYLAVIAVLTITPGPDMLLALRNGIRGGAHAAWVTGLGCCTGIAIHATLAVLGLSAILAASSEAFTVVKVAGAAYLVVLGVQAVVGSFRGGARSPGDSALPPPSGGAYAAHQRSSAGAHVALRRSSAGAHTAPPWGGDRASPVPVGVPAGGYFRQGLVTNLLNPKIALLFLTLLPQFVAGGEPRVATTALLAAVFLGIAVLWWRAFSLVVGPLGRFLSRPGVVAWFDRVTGALLVGLGVRVAVEGD